MSDHYQRAAFSAPPGSGSGWGAEPSFAEMMLDPMVQKLMDSDRVSRDCFNGLVSSVRQSLGR